MKVISRTIAALFLSSIMGLPAQADIISIDFESDTLGLKANDFSSVDAPGVTFTDTIGAELTILTGTEADGQSLAIFSDQDSSGLSIDFGGAIDFLELSFGNDDPLSTNPGDLATLRLYLAAALVAEVTTELNRDDLMNQTLSYGGVGGAVLFDSAVFAFTNPFGFFDTGGGATANVGTTEVVDNIVFNTVAVPEPATLGMMLLGFLLLPALRRR